MDALHCIAGRRSCRSYEERPVPAAMIDELLRLGTKAATGSGLQPWGFAVLEGQETLRALSDEIKAWLLPRLEEEPWLAQYEEWLHRDSYNIFYNAPALVAVYGDPASHWYIYDASLCAANIMLAAHAQGLGTCWICFAESFLNRSEIKARYHVPEDFRLVSALTLGFARGHLPEAERRPPRIFYRG